MTDHNRYKVVKGAEKLGASMSNRIELESNNGHLAINCPCETCVAMRSELPFIL